jgi:RHS repeat-associated protein
MTMAGISSKALNNAVENKYRFNGGNELQNKEFSDGSGLELYDAKYRMYDAQIGRFHQIDPLTDEGGQESLTPYQFSYNNPVRYNDPDGKCPTCVVGGIIGFVVDAAIQVGASVAKSALNGEKVSLSTIVRDYNGFQGAAAFGAGFVTQGLSSVEQGAAATVKVAAANMSISIVNQTNKDGNVDPVQTAIDALPLPEVKGGNIVSTKNAEKAVTQAENSISSSTSRIPDRKTTRLNDARQNLQAQQTTNSRAKAVLSNARESVVKEVTNSFQKSINNPTPPPIIPVIPIPINDNTRVVNNNVILR